jgi:CheY-like chemotaxis protein
MAKVMLVEDDNNLREIYEARMQAEGYDVVSAKDGEEALVVAKAEKPELVISDVMMPKISGFEMLDILRNTDGLKDVKVIMLTALGQADDQQRADRLGADRYLVKSQVTLEDIVNVAHQLLGDLPQEAAPEPVVAAVPEPVVTTPPPTVAITPAPVIASAPEPVAVVASVPMPIAVAPTVAASEPVEPMVVPVVTPTPEAVAAPAATAAPAVVAEPVPPQTSFSAVQVEPPAMPAVATPAPAAEPVIATATMPAVVGDGAQSTAQEEATVEAQIEDFVSGATSDAPAPVVPSAPDVAPMPPVVAAVVPPTVTAEQAANAVTDDKIMADAVNNLVSNTTAEPVPVAPTTELVITPSPESVKALSPAEETAASGTPTVNASVSMIAGKKIISPLSSADAKPDLNTLLAQEEAKESSAQAASQSAVTSAPVTPQASAVIPPAPDTSGKPDPSSIAL